MTTCSSTAGTSHMFASLASKETAVPAASSGWAAAHEWLECAPSAYFTVKTWTYVCNSSHKAGFFLYQHFSWQAFSLFLLSVFILLMEHTQTHTQAVRKYDKGMKKSLFVPRQARLSAAIPLICDEVPSSLLLRTHCLCDVTEQPLITGRLLWQCHAKGGHTNLVSESLIIDSHLYCGLWRGAIVSWIEANSPSPAVLKDTLFTASHSAEVRLKKDKCFFFSFSPAGLSQKVSFCFRWSNKTLALDPSTKTCSSKK